MNDKHWMQKAYEQALIAQSRGEVPIGAVLVSADQQLLAAAGNAVQKNCDPTAHAEIEVLRAASSLKQNYRLPNTTLYVTLEPCIMCAGALIQARVQRLVFASRDFQVGAAGSQFNVLNGYPLNHKVLVDEGPMQQASTLLLDKFFQSCR